ncbi:MAG: response regulator transcription factor [Lachnospiraceae bacterium]|nr:response regulator transcription factor [Lachnospiraceae bacterium]
MKRVEEIDISETRILIIEDEKPIADLLKYDLCREGFAVKCAYTGAQGMLVVEEFEPQLVLLDWMLPDLSGVDLLKLLTDNYEIPVIMLTARGAIEDKVYGMSCGADDYITKPFDLREVNIRIRAVLRRFQKTMELEKRGQIRIPDGLIYENDRIVVQDGEQVELTRKEFDLLLWMVRHPRQVFTRERLLDVVWDYDYAGDTRTVDIHIQRLRKKLRAGKAIITVFGVGYKYAPEET